MFTPPYSPQTKAEALRMLQSGVSQAQVSRTLGVSRKTLLKWLGPSPQVTPRDKGGRFAKGYSGHPGGRSAARAEAERLAAEATPLAMRELFLLAESMDEAPSETQINAGHLKLKTLREMLDRGLGRPRQHVETTQTPVYLDDLLPLVEEVRALVKAEEGEP